MWNKFGKFANNGSSVLNYGYSISQLIKSELLNKTDSFEGECLTDDCWSIVERIMRSIYVLAYVASQTPSSPGQYLAYHINTILGEDSASLEHRAGFYSQSHFGETLLILAR